MTKKIPRCLPPRNYVDPRTKLKEIRKKQKELHEGLYQGNGLFVTHVQDMNAYEPTMQHDRRINR